jgi:hypothetical protein
MVRCQLDHRLELPLLADRVCRSTALSSSEVQNGVGDWRPHARFRAKIVDHKWLLFAAAHRLAVRLDRGNQHASSNIMASERTA